MTTVRIIPVFTNAQIMRALQINWGGAQQGILNGWAGPRVTYSVPGTAPTDLFGAAVETAGFVAPDAVPHASTSLSLTGMAAMAFELWDDLIAISLDPVRDPALAPKAQISVAFSTTTRGGGIYALTRGSAQLAGTLTLDAARVWLNPAWPEFQQWAYGERGLEAVIHEIGHTLGLSHPAVYDVSDAVMPTYAEDAGFTKDTLRWTVMSYFAANSDNPAVDRLGAPTTSDVNGDGINAATPLIYDILAIQQKYGADPTTRTGDDTYGFNAKLSGPWRPVFAFDPGNNPDPVIAIYDAGGRDTLDTSGFTTNQRISLVPGTLSDVGNLTQNVGIAFGTVIENAIGGSGDDTITGNTANNRLSGGAGRDVMRGAAGADVLAGGAGADQLTGDAGDDRLIGGAGVDRLTGGAGRDTFVFRAVPTGLGERDTIYDFASGTDRIELAGAAFTGVATGVLVLGSAAHHAGDPLLYNQAKGLLLYDADGSGAGAAVQIAHLVDAPVLAASDIVVI